MSSEAKLHFVRDSVDIDFDNAGIIPTDGLHCGVEPVGGRILDYLDLKPIDTVWPMRIYPEAVAA